jgi:hypothetical protein
MKKSLMKMKKVARYGIQACNPSTLKAETESGQSLRPVWAS